jgi:hypothetical protein
MALTPVYLCSQQAVIDRMGGAVAAAQVLDPNQTGTYDTGLLDRARFDASADVMAAAGNRVKLWLDSNNVPQWVESLTAWLGAWYAWNEGTKGKAIPENVQKKYDEIKTKDLENLRRGETGTGYGEPPVRTALRPSPIDNSDEGRRAVYSTFRRSGWG